MYTSDEGYIYRRAKNTGGKKILANFANYSSLLIFTISIAFPMQMDFNLPKFFFRQTSYSPYSPNLFTTKVLYYMVQHYIIHGMSCFHLSVETIYSGCALV